jgi:hypothetical protein
MLTQLVLVCFIVWLSMSENIIFNSSFSFLFRNDTNTLDKTIDLLRRTRNRTNAKQAIVFRSQNTIAIKINGSLNRMDNASFDNILLAKFIIFGDPFTMNLNFIDRKVGGSNLAGVMKIS